MGRLNVRTAEWRKTAGWAASLTSIGLILFGTFVCFRRIEIYYYAYFGWPRGRISAIRETVDWAVAAVLIVGGLFLLRFARKVEKSE